MLLFHKIRFFYSEHLTTWLEKCWKILSKYWRMFYCQSVGILISSFVKLDEFWLVQYIYSSNYGIEYNSYLFLILAAIFMIIIHPLFDGSIGSVNNSWFEWQYWVRQSWSLTFGSVYSSFSWQPCVRYILYILFKMGSEKLAQTGLLLIYITDNWNQINTAILPCFSSDSGVADDSVLMGCDSVLFGGWFVTFLWTVAP